MTQVVGFTETAEDVMASPVAGCCEECDDILDAEAAFMAAIASLAGVMER